MWNHFMEDSLAHLRLGRRKSHLKSATIQSFLQILSFCRSDSIASCPAPQDVVPETVLNLDTVSVNPSSNHSQKNESFDFSHHEMFNQLDAQELNVDGNRKLVEEESSMSRKRDSNKGAVGLDKVESNRLLIEKEGDHALTDIQKEIFCERESVQTVQVEGGNEFALRNDVESKKMTEEEARVTGQSVHCCLIEQELNSAAVRNSDHVLEHLQTEEVRHEMQEAVNNQSKSVNSIQVSAQNDALPSKQLSVDELGHHHIPPEDQKLETADSSDPIASSISSIGHQDVEEGEIPDDFGFLEQESVPEDHCKDFDNRVVEEVQVSDGLVAQCGLAQTTTGQSAADSKNMASGSNLTSGFKLTANCRAAKIDPRKVTGKGDGANASGNKKTNKARQSFSINHVQALGKMVEGNKNDIVQSKEGIPAGLGPIGEVTEYLGTESAEKNNRACKKKKRTPLTEERKGRKKASKRQKRAQLNREQGVKRLKLTPFTKPKVVHDCKYYLKGRCQQGEKCKFSHGGVPLTKSQPCSYFANGTCLKGEDCPFDHQLSNYPCINYNLKGMCRRGEACLFSHKIPLSEGFLLASKFKNAESMLLPGKTKMPETEKTNDLNSKSGNRLFKSLTQARSVTSQRHLQNSQMDTKAETQPKLPAKVPGGIRFLSIGKAPLDDASKQLQNKSSPSEDINNKTNNSHKQNAEEKPCNKNEMPSRAQQSAFSSKPPAGIRFFSLGKASLDDTSGQLRITNSPSDRKNNNETMNSHVQTTVKKPCNSNVMTCRRPASPISSCPTSKSSVDVGQSLQSSSLSACCSVQTLAKKDGSDLTTHFFQPSPSSSSTKNVSGSGSSRGLDPTQPPSSSQGGLNDASKILEEFLFSGLN